MQFRYLALSLILAASLRAADPPGDPAVALARLLAAKGTITAAELASLTAALPTDRVATLAAILRRKGVLTDTEVAQFRPPAAPAASAAAPAASRTLADLPVTTHENAAVTLYGTLLFNAFYNTAATNIEDIPLFASKQGADPTGGDKNFGMTARQTRLGLRLQRTNVLGARLSGQFEFDLLGGQTPFGNGIDMDIFRLRLAFGRLDWSHFAFEGGQDWALFAPLNPTSLAAYAIPDFSASGNPWIRLPQIRAEFKSGAADSNRFLWQVAALDPNMGDYPTAAFSASRQPGIGERGRMPALESRVAWTGRVDGHDLTLGLSGHYGRGKNGLQPVDSWGVALDYTVPIGRVFVWSGEAFVGRALGIFSVTSGEAVGAPGTAAGHGVESRGGWTQAEFNLTHLWQVNLGYGLEVPNANQLAVGARWRNQNYMGNLMFKPSPNVNIAWEYRRVLTDYRNQPFANERGDIINLALAYIF